MPGVIIPTPDGGLVGIHGDDSGTWTRVAVDANGHLQIDQLSAANPPNLDIAISALRDAITTAAPTGNDLADLYSRLGDILTELETKLETADLNLDVDKDLQVDVKSSALPSGAATEATLAAVKAAVEKIDDLQGALGSVNTDDLQVDVKTSALPAGAATSAKQDTMITALQLIDDLQAALASVATDQIRTDVISSTLPTGAATSAKQDTMITALQLIDDLQQALASIAGDQLRADIIASLPAGDNNIGNVDIVTAPDLTVIPGSGEKLFGFSGIVEEALSNTNLSAGTNHLYGTTVPAGEIWVVTQSAVFYTGTAPSALIVRAKGLATDLHLFQVSTVTVNHRYANMHQAILQEGDNMQFTVTGATAGDNLYGRYAGYKLAAP